MTEFPETQASLLAKIKSHDDRRAWEQFVSRYRPIIYRMARRKGFQEADAQDLTQRVLTAVANSIHRWKKLDSSIRFRHWLRRVVKNAIINAATRRPPEIAFGGLMGQAILLAQADDPDSEREIDLEYRREIFKQAASIVRHDVNVETWDAFELTVVKGNSIDEAAAKLNKSPGSVYAARSRIMRRLKDAVNHIEDF